MVEQDVLDEAMDIESYEHQLVVTENVTQCKCGATHVEGDAIWGGMFHPDDMGEHNPWESLAMLHGVELAYKHKP